MDSIGTTYGTHEANSQSSKNALDFPLGLRPGLTELLKAYGYAHSAKQDVWQLAVERACLRGLGLSDSDFRWLVCMGYVEHSREVTPLDDDGREFRQTGNLSFSKRTCFVLTQEGASFARDVVKGGIEVKHALAGSERVVDLKFPRLGNGKSAKPYWDADRRELRLNGILVKQFKWTAANQELVLAAFEEEGWATHVDDPLPPEPEQDPKRRLSDTIKCLNRKQQNALIHFRGDGTGEGVIWELVNGDAEGQV
ncbi:MAG TPA: hypothetical protein VMM76_12060 [Pirellulaceae bacterium]|nr:hypothetical protein [Pirellulaceae bacterium]